MDRRLTAASGVKYASAWDDSDAILDSEVCGQ